MQPSSLFRGIFSLVSFKINMNLTRRFHWSLFSIPPFSVTLQWPNVQLNGPASARARHNSSCPPHTLVFQGTAQCLCHLLIAFPPVVKAMALCRRPKEEEEGQAANLELAGREQRQHLVSLEKRTEGCCSSLETRTNKGDN